MKLSGFFQITKFCVFGTKFLLVSSCASGLSPYFLQLFLSVSNVPQLLPIPVQIFLQSSKFLGQNETWCALKGITLHHFLTLSTNPSGHGRSLMVIGPCTDLLNLDMDVRHQILLPLTQPINKRTTPYTSHHSSDNYLQFVSCKHTSSPSWSF